MGLGLLDESIWQDSRTDNAQVSPVTRPNEMTRPVRLRSETITVIGEICTEQSHDEKVSAALCEDGARGAQHKCLEDTAIFSTDKNRCWAQ